MGTLKRIEYIYDTVVDDAGQPMWSVTRTPSLIIRAADPPQGPNDEIEYDSTTLFHTWDGEEHDLLSLEVDWPAACTWGDSRKEETGTV
jgi:hypothetical protein